MMEPVTTFEQMISHIKTHTTRKRVAVVCGYDDFTFYAVTRAIEDGLATFILVGELSTYKDKYNFSNDKDQYKISNDEDQCELGNDENQIIFIDAANAETAARKAVSLIHTGQADILMKGIVSTDILLHAILNKETGLLPHGQVLTHLAVMQIPSYNKLLFLTDAAVIPNPTYEQRLAMIDDAIQVCHRFGIVQPRISLIHCNEKINPKFPITMDYERIVDYYKKQSNHPAIVDGPLDVRVSCDKSSMEIKGITSPIDGQADVLIFPNIEAGNTFYKAVTLFAHAEMAGMLIGPQCPVVLTSRSDSALTKFYSLCMACIQ